MFRQCAIDKHEIDQLVVFLSSTLYDSLMKLRDEQAQMGFHFGECISKYLSRQGLNFPETARTVQNEGKLQVHLGSGEKSSGISRLKLPFFK